MRLIQSLGLTLLLLSYDTHFCPPSLNPLKKKKESGRDHGPTDADTFPFPWIRQRGFHHRKNTYVSCDLRNFNMTTT